MSIHRRLLISILITVVVPLRMVHAQSDDVAPRLWVTATSTPAQQNLRWAGIRDDAPSQWKPDAQWQTVASHVKVAKLIAGNVENTRPDDLHALIDEINRRHLELGLEIGPLVRSAACNSKTEAYGGPGETEAILQKIRKAGGNLRYLAMDEPFNYGHRDTGGCHDSAAELARQVAQSIASMRQIFPKLQVGDIEVIGANREWTSELAQWADAYRAAVGEPLAFLHADVGWSSLAMANLVTVDAEMKRRHIPFGIIYNAADTANNDLEWSQSAVSHFVEIESVLNVHPEDVIFQSWTRNPTHVLPEGQSGTLMSVALTYLRPPGSAHLSNSEGDISGVLTDQGGHPLVDASVTVAAIDVGARLGPSARHLEGTVPAGAVTGVIGVRVGNEGSCICAGARDPTPGAGGSTLTTGCDRCRAARSRAGDVREGVSAADHAVDA